MRKEGTIESARWLLVVGWLVGRVGWLERGGLNPNEDCLLIQCEQGMECPSEGCR
jgi:hypothetical protein